MMAGFSVTGAKILNDRRGGWITRRWKLWKRWIEMNVVSVYGYVRRIRYLVTESLDSLEEAVSQLAEKVGNKVRDELVGAETIIPILGDIGTAYKKGMKVLEILHSLEDEVLRGLVDLMERIVEWLIKEKGYEVSKVGVLNDSELVPSIEVEVPGIDIKTAEEITKEVRDEFGLGLFDVMVTDKITLPILTLETIKGMLKR